MWRHREFSNSNSERVALLTLINLTVHFSLWALILWNSAKGRALSVEPSTLRGTVHFRDRQLFLFRTVHFLFYPERHKLSVFSFYWNVDILIKRRIIPSFKRLPSSRFITWSIKVPYFAYTTRVLWQLPWYFYGRIRFFENSFKRLFSFILVFKAINEFLLNRMFSIVTRVILRVVQTQTISFMQSISERGGSDMERFWILNDIILNQFCKFTSFKFGVVLCRIRPFPTLISKIKWLGSELPLNMIMIGYMSIKVIYRQKL